MDHIVSQISSLVKISPRLQHIVAYYILTLMLDTSKRSLGLASSISGRHKSQFSRMLAKHSDLAINTLTSLAMETAARAARDRNLLNAGAPWTIALIIDATLHTRSALHVHNAQRFNHGQGFVIGHQWTNIVIYVNDHLVPLPPIPFLTRKECKRQGIEYCTEHEALAEYLGSLELSKYVGFYRPEEVVVLTDSGYDNKKLQRIVLDQGWDFLGALKASRGVQSKHEAIKSSKSWHRITDLFWATRKSAPWTKVRTETDEKGKKRRKIFRARKLTGRIKGVKQDVTLVCSEKANHKGRRYFACSNTKVSVGTIVRIYRIRWQIEMFHRVIKTQLGLQDASVVNFTSLISHVQWVYCSWLVLDRLVLPSKATSRLDKQRELQKMVSREPVHRELKKILAAATQFGGLARQRSLARAVIGELMVA